MDLVTQWVSDLGGWGEIRRNIKGQRTKAGAIQAKENAHTAPAFKTFSPLNAEPTPQPPFVFLS